MCFGHRMVPPRYLGIGAVGRMHGQGWIQRPGLPGDLPADRVHKGRSGKGPDGRFPPEQLSARPVICRGVAVCAERDEIAHPVRMIRRRLPIAQMVYAENLPLTDALSALLPTSDYPEDFQNSL